MLFCNAHEICTQLMFLFFFSKSMRSHINVNVSHFSDHLIDHSNVYPGYQQRRHQYSGLLALCVGNPNVAGGFPAHGQRSNNGESDGIMT